MTLLLIIIIIILDIGLLGGRLTAFVITMFVLLFILSLLGGGGFLVFLGLS